jgi:hypothetical protein
MNRPAPGGEPAVRTCILNDTAAVKSTAQRWAREKEAKIGAGVWMWWTDGSRSHDARVGAAAVYEHGNQWSSHCSFLGTGHLDVFHAELWAIGLPLDLAIVNRDTLQIHVVGTVAVFSN